MSLNNRVVLLLGQDGVSSVQESENSPDLNLPAPCFIVCSHFLSCSSPYIHPSVTDTNPSLGFISKLTFFIIRCELLVFLSPPQVFVPVSVLKSGLETATHPLRDYKTASH